MSSALGYRDIYEGRVNRALDVITRDIAGDLSLGRLAAEAGFSPYHFHRIFRSITGVTLAEVITRTRLDRARTMMAQNPHLPLTQVAITCGFGSSSNYSRVFRKHYGVPPSTFDHRAHRDATEHERAQWYRESRPPPDQSATYDLKVRRIPARTIAYLRVTKPYEDGRVLDVAARLADIIEERQLRPQRWLGYTRDHPDFVAANHCTYDVGVELPAEQPRLRPPLGRLELPTMTVAELTLSGSLDEEILAIDWLYTVWLPGSGYEPTNHPMFEAWPRRPFTGADQEDLLLHVPVIRLRHYTVCPPA
ncbi:MAG: helix-turn-helix domain-containing protein [Ornithinimicrobium sp.]